MRPRGYIKPKSIPNVSLVKRKCGGWLVEYPASIGPIRRSLHDESGLDWFELMVYFE